MEVWRARITLPQWRLFADRRNMSSVGTNRSASTASARRWSRAAGGLFVILVLMLLFVVSVAGGASIDVWPLFLPWLVLAAVAAVALLVARPLRLGLAGGVLIGGAQAVQWGSGFFSSDAPLWASLAMLVGLSLAGAGAALMGLVRLTRRSLFGRSDEHLNAENGVTNRMLVVAGVALAAVVILGVALLGPRPGPSSDLERVVAGGASSPRAAFAEAGIEASRACVFGPYSTDGAIADELGFAWADAASTGIASLDGHELVIAADADRVIAWALVARPSGSNLVGGEYGCEATA